jgi:hypothetical protein
MGKRELGTVASMGLRLAQPGLAEIEYAQLRLLTKQ